MILTALSMLALGPTAAPAAEDRREPSRVLPAAGLAAYLEFDGLDAHPDAWKATAAYGMLHDTTAGAVMTHVAAHSLRRILRLIPDVGISSADIVLLQQHIVRHGFALAHYDRGESATTVLVFHALGDAEVRARFARVLRFLLRADPGARLPGPSKFRGRSLYQIGGNSEKEPAGDAVPDPANNPTTPLSWWMEGDTLVVVTGPDPAPLPEGKRRLPGNDAVGPHKLRIVNIVDTIEGREPAAATHPTHRAALAEGRDIAGFEADGLFFADSNGGQAHLEFLRDVLLSPDDKAKGVATEFDGLDALGLTRSERIVGRWGFRGKALVTDLRFAAPGPRGGLAGMLRPAGLRTDRLPPLPRGAGAIAVGAFGGGQFREVIGPLRKGLVPDAAAGLKEIEQLLAVEPLRGAADDLVRRLGPTWCLYAAPRERGEPGRPADPALVIEFEDAEAVDRALAAIAARWGAYVNEKEAAGAEKPSIGIERLPAPDRGYRLALPGAAKSWLKDGRVTFLLGKAHLVVAPSLAQARAAIAAEDAPEMRWHPTGELLRSLEGLPAHPAALIVGNPRDSVWPAAVGNLRTMGVVFVEKLLGIEADGGVEAAGFPVLRRAFGPAQAIVGFGPARAPSIAALRRYVFPSVTAATVDDQGVRLVRLEALPLGCLGLKTRFEDGGQLTATVEFGPGEPRP